MKRNNVTKLVIGALVMGALGLPLVLHSETKGTEQAAPAAPVTDCFESREVYTAVQRVENAVPEYGYPNIKCSQTTGGVLWWGNPYDGTEPMGEMPLCGDATCGSYEKGEEAVVKPREPRLMYFNMDPKNNCKMCHDGKQVPVPTTKKPRLLAFHQDIVENSLQLMHGRAAFWCIDCHSPTNRNRLIDHWGNEIAFNQPQKLCGKCHGEVYIDWRLGIHGKRIGSWMAGGKKRWWTCTECHNPHTVQVNRFQALKPEPAPVLPKGMKDASHEQHHGGGHGSGHGDAKGGGGASHGAAH